MRKSPSRPLLCALLALASASCSILEVDTRSGPPRVVSDGIVDGHVALGVPDQERFLTIDLFDGRSSGAVAEVAIWKLFRVELGIAGASVGVGPFELGFGVLAYDPALTRQRFGGDEESDEHFDDEEHDDGHDVHVHIDTTEIQVDRKSGRIDDDPYEPEFD